MKIISIGTDESILNKNSRAYERVREYGEIFESFQILVFTKNKKFKKIEEKEINFQVVPIYGRNKLLQVFGLFAFFNGMSKGGGRAAARKENISQTILSSQDVFEVGFLTYIISRIYKYKLYVQIHTDISTPYFRNESFRNLFQFFLAKFMLKKADRIRVVSKKMFDYLSPYRVGGGKVFLLPIYTDISQFEFNLKKEKTNTILMISRIEEVKNIPLGIRAVQALRKISRINYKLKIVGKGNLKQKYTKSFKNRNWIEWADWTDNVEKEYHAADCLMITSNYEGWGLTAVESVACGTPVCISPVGVANEFIISGENGVVSRGHDIGNMMEAIYYTLTTEFDESKMLKTLEILDNKKTYLEKMKAFYTA
jgi:glycosyltransferase involved in cell wall biosynthesis